MEWWDRLLLPAKRVWIRFARRLRLRKTGLGRLRQEVSTCEYEDVHVMWEILQRCDTDMGRRSAVARRSWRPFEWGPRGICGRF